MASGPARPRVGKAPDAPRQENSGRAPTANGPTRPRSGTAAGFYDYWHALWEQACDDPAPGPRLSAYREAAAHAAAEHPYPDLVDPAWSTPADGYVPQRVAARTEADTPAAPLPAPAVFGAPGPVSLLVGAPGCGKSTLLRVHVAGTAEHGHGRAGRAVPVLVRAAKLTDKVLFARALATVVGEALARHLEPGALTTDFFRRPPAPRAVWLVLVDGLDEVPDPAARAALLRTLAEAAEDGPYRFVVTTRPLPPDELDGSAAHFDRFELLPFTTEDLRGYARDRFRALDDPDGCTDRFMTLLADGKLEALARTPLMAAMLCTVYRADPGARLPKGRTAVYTRFVELIHLLNPHKRIRETHERAIEALESPFQHMPDRLAVRSAAEQARDALPELIGCLALRLLFTGAASVAEALDDHELGRPPAPLEGEPADWHRFLTDLLLSTGLLTVQDGELAFPHRTFLEYHAARYATRTERGRRAEIHDLIDCRWFAPPSWPFSRMTWSMSIIRVSFRTLLGFGAATPVLTHGHMSYAGFVLDLVAGSGTDLDRKLLRVARRGGAEGGTFIALQTALGTGITPEAADAARATLAGVALGSRKVPGEERLLAAEALAALAEDPDVLDTLNQWHFFPQGLRPPGAPPSLYELDHVRSRTRRDTVAKLDAVLRDPTLDEAFRREAAGVRRAFGRLIGEEAAP
ncbi:NACHT domain-containing protein [Streptomyces gamaensis]|uniref:NACHT domain-containing protein n=1 Tax=Streptomyces gamaensis TaxID=1763542 RepID=A0ABW0Z556_9ACTN